MKTSKLIKKLQEAMIQYGDIDVCFRDTTKGFRNVGNVSPAYTWKAEHILVDEADSVLILDIE